MNVHTIFYKIFTNWKIFQAGETGEKKTISQWNIYGKSINIHLTGQLIFFFYVCVQINETKHTQINA